MTGNGPDTSIVITAASVVLVRAGLGLWTVGASRSKHAASAGIRGLSEFCVGLLSFWAIGMAVLFQMRNGFLGVEPHFLVGLQTPDVAASYFAALVLVATAVSTSAVAERCRFIVVVVQSALIGTLLLPIVGHWIWFGWLRAMGVLDIGGAAPVHLLAGTVGLVGSWMVGARNGKFNHDGSTNMIPGHNMSLLLSGVLISIAGWIPWLAGLGASGDLPVATTIMNALVSTAAAGAVSMLLSYRRFGKVDGALLGGAMLGGMVAISSAAGSVPGYAALVIGLVAGWLVPQVTLMLDTKFRIDDPAGSISIHGAGGAWALLAAGIFRPAPVADRFHHLGMQLLALVVVVAFVAATTGAVLKLLRAAGPLRVREVDEYDGLDLAEHDVNAYPDFQQTMIKSYHLREA